MIARKRGFWLMLALTVLGLGALPGLCLAQASDAEKARQDAQKAQQDLLEKQLKALEVRARYLSGFGTNRLGATMESPSAAVASQLDLPKGQGQVVKSVQPNSAAAKAGIQANDILLEVDGKSVSSNMQEFQKTLDALKPDTKVEAVVLRKGQKTRIKELTLPKADQFGQAYFQAPGTVVDFANARAIMSPQVPGKLLPSEVEGQLKLTAEQKEKLAKLQKDTEAKLMELLTDEQKKQLEELKNPTRLRKAVPLPGQPLQRSEEQPRQKQELRKNPEQKQEEAQNQVDEARKQAQEQAQKARQQAQEEAEKARQQAQEALKQAQVELIRAGRGGAANRLGATLETPSDTVVNQLNLPQGQGLVVKTVPPNTPAAKAGLQPNDILLELGGKTISRNPADFDKSVEQVKADTPVDAVVLRKGEKTTVKGVSLAAAPAVRPATALLRNIATPKVPGDLLPAAFQDQLKLTAEQKDKLAKLQKETEAKLMELLTEEQKKQLEELKKNPRQGLKIIIDGIDIEIPNK
jgi:C-terminal processing protease CtpA/Prc